MQEFLYAVLSFFLIEPLQAEMASRFGNLSPQSVTAISACIRDATPVFIQQAYTDPWQAATNVFAVWTGTTPPEQILAKTTSGCADVVKALPMAGKGT